MTHHDEAVVTDRLRRALLAFQSAQIFLLNTHRRLKALPQAEVEAFWNGRGRRAEADMRLAAAEVVAAFKAFSEAGLVADVNDRRLVTEAQRYLAEGTA
ncbi:MAG: hypothetical protein ACJ8H8_11880 [Geminicoccaceae bacterium]